MSSSKNILNDLSTEILASNKSCKQEMSEKVDELGNTFLTDYEDFQRQTSRENGIFRDNVQTALLNSKNDLALRVDTMDTRLNAQIAELHEQVTRE